MKLKFIATKGHTCHNSVFDQKRKEDRILFDGDVCEVSDKKGEILQKDFPFNFFVVTSSGAVVMPEKNIKEQPNKMVDNKKPKTKTK